MRVAIVGLGPKGLYALERLLDHARELGDVLAIDVFEPHRSPGAGPWYDPTQPAYLRMNIAAEHVDMWWPGSRAVPVDRREPFTAWRARTGALDDGAYPSRALVGSYLACGLQALLDHAAADVRVHAARVSALEPEGSGWCAVADDGRHGPYDEVLVATGHVPGAAYPLDASQLPHGAAVAVRGFALTFIDVALGLAATRPDVTVLPFSRTGRPLHPKPVRGMADAIDGLAEIAARGSAALRALPRPAALARDVLPVLAAVADESLAAAGATGAAGAGSWLARAATGPAQRSGEDPVTELTRALAVARGSAAPGLGWALGHAWRAVYPALVEQLGGDGLARDDWPAFLRLSGELERIAFGPSPDNTARLLELIASGQVDLSLLTGRRELRPDVVIDAVLPPPGIVPGSGSLPERLVADGHARVAPHRRGIAVAADGSCGPPGLALIGRPTEDSVIGNDTLIRSLHPLADRWAQRVAARARTPSMALR